MCVWGVGGRGRDRQRGREGERERECVCVCVDGFIVECPRPPPLLYTLRLGLMIRLGALEIFVYITLYYSSITIEHSDITDGPITLCPITLEHNDVTERIDTGTQ